MQRKKVKAITTATLFYKPKSKIIPDFWGAKTETWIIFPFEIRECMRSIGKKWREQKVDQQEIEDRFEQMGFAKEMIKYFGKLK